RHPPVPGELRRERLHRIDRLRDAALATQPLDPSEALALEGAGVQEADPAACAKASRTSVGACTSSMRTPSPPSGNASLPLGWMKHTSWPAAPWRMPPGVKRTPWASSQA